MSVQEDLLEVFATNRVEDLERDNGRLLKEKFRKQSVDELTADQDYADSFAFIKERKEQLERMLARCDGEINKQISLCLDTLQHAASDGRPGESAVFYSLIKGSVYLTNWNVEQRREFDRKFEFIMKWQHFFLSYTNRDAITTNNRFAKLIRFALGGVRRDDREKTNLVARIVARLLQKDNNLSGFFDYNDIKSGDDIGDKIREYCQKCFAFIQIVESLTFATPEVDKRNWCFEEYCEFKRNKEMQTLCGGEDEKRYHFIIALEQVAKPANLTATYQDWFNHVARIHAESVYGPRYDGRSNYDILFRVVGEVAKQIVQLRKSAIDNMLSRE